MLIPGNGGLLKSELTRADKWMMIFNTGKCEASTASYVP